jgi:hypothetical protein
MRCATNARRAACAALLIAAPATAIATAADKSASSLLRPTPDADLRDLATDRPDKTESPYTVDAGRFQVEMDLVAYTRDKPDGITTHTLDVVPFNVKVGLTNRSDLQIGYDTFSRVRTKAAGLNERDRGSGDVVVRLKHNIWGNDGGATALAVMPFVKLPVGTLSDLNDDVEGGVIVPFAIDLGGGFGLGMMTEVDILRRENGGGYAPVFVNSAALGFELTERIGLFAEVFVERSAEHGVETVVTLGGGVTYAATENLQLDTAVNFGATDAADDLNILVGLSQRF